MTAIFYENLPVAQLRFDGEWRLGHSREWHTLDPSPQA